MTEKPMKGLKFVDLPKWLKEITKEDIDERINEFVQLVNFDIALV